MQNKFANESDLKKILSWCEKRKIKVQELFGAETYREGTTIVINSSLSLSKKVVYLLHECGHVLIDSEEDCPRFGKGYPSFHVLNVRKTFSHRSSIVFEELEAWKRGWDLAKRLKLKVSKSFYSKQKNKALKIYFHWALNPKKQL
jgi:hypothetical protein